MISIVAVDKNWGIGFKGSMPWIIPGELDFFKEQTIGNTIVMGRKTLESLPGGKPLPGRRNIVLTSDSSRVGPGIETASDIGELFDLINSDKNVFIIGGEQIYRLLLPYCRKALVTKVDGIYETDTVFPNLDDDITWGIDSVSEPVTAGNNITYRRCIYINRSPIG